MTHEYELKFLNVDKDKTRILFKEKGYILSQPEIMMRRQAFHLPDNHPERNCKWGRVRDEGYRITAAIKWYDNPENPSISDVHEEEIIVETWQEGEDWVTNQGYTLTAHQENTREAWIKPDITGLEVTIDVWPGLNPYVEVEAPTEQAVKDASTELGFDFDAGIAGGVERVYEIEMNIPAKEVNALPLITFDTPPLKRKERENLCLV